MAAKLKSHVADYDGGERRVVLWTDELADALERNDAVGFVYRVLEPAFGSYRTFDGICGTVIRSVLRSVADLLRGDGKPTRLCVALSQEGVDAVERRTAEGIQWLDAFSYVPIIPPQEMGTHSDPLLNGTLTLFGIPVHLGTGFPQASADQEPDPEPDAVIRVKE